MSTSRAPVGFYHLFSSFSREVRRIRQTWAIWFRMFDDDKAPHMEEVKEFDGGLWPKAFDSMPTIMAVFRDSMLCDLVASVQRFNDPLSSRTKGGSRENLTMDRVLQAMNLSSTDAWAADIRDVADSFKANLQAGNLVNGRHHRPGHNDLKTMLGEPLIIDFEHLESAIRDLSMFRSRCIATLRARATGQPPQVGFFPDGQLEHKLQGQVDELIRRLTSKVPNG